MKKIHSTISWPLFVFVWGVLSFVLIAAVRAEAWLSLVFYFPVVLFIGHMYYNTFYTITSEHLLIKCGFLYNQQISIKDIISIDSTNDLASAPALDLARLRVRYKGGMTIISPKDQILFIQQLRDVGGVFEDKVTGNH